MKIKTVESLLKQTKFITLYDDDRCQWVSNGHACYPLRNMPLLDADSIFTMLDVPEDKKDKLWKRVYPYITGVRLVPDGERSVST